MTIGVILNIVHNVAR